MKLKLSHNLRLIFTILILGIFAIPYQAYSQEAVIKNIIEDLTEKSETEFDYSDLLDEFLALNQNPVNINATQSQELISLFLLDELQYRNLRQYIDSNGYLLSSQELLLIDGFTPQNIINLSPFIKAGRIEKAVKVKPSKILRYGSHQIFTRYQRTLQEADGYKNRTDSTWDDNPNSKYLGNADKYYLKYQFKYSNMISAGLVAEKDAGEIFFENIDHPVLDSLIGDKVKKGFDFYTAHLFVQKIGILDQAVVGDYHLQFGQGLNMWSSLAFGKSSNALNIKKYERGIKANTSTDENKFLRGAAAQLKKDNWLFTAFYSSKEQDASSYYGAEDQETNFVESINGTGFHRTINELLKKNSIQVQLMGGRLKYTKNLFSLGIIASHTILNKELLSTGTPYQYFNFTGTENTIIGSEFQFRWKNIDFFGELSYNIDGGLAYLAGLNAPLSNRVAIAILFRNYNEKYNNLFGAAFGENTANKNERGIYTGLSFQISKKLHLNTYVDLFSSPWLRYRTDAPSYGSEFLALLNYEYSRKVLMQFRVKYKNKMLNYTEEYAMTSNLENQVKYGFRYHISYQVHPLFTLKNRIEYQIFESKDVGQKPGFLIYQDINYKSKNNALGMSARFALFDVEDYNSRLYAYENDLLYVFSIPAYYNRGVRAYFVLNYRINSTFQFWFKLGHTWYENVDEVGSGLNRIDGGNKTEVRAQLRIKI